MEVQEICRGNVDYRIPGMPHSTVQKEDSNRKETMKRLIQQFENHPNRCSFTQDLNKTEEFNPLSEKSKELITSMGNTEYFELRETSSKIQLGMSNTTSLCQISGGLKHKFNNMTHLHWKIIPTWLHLKKEVVKQRPVTNEATQKCTRLYSSGFVWRISQRLINPPQMRILDRW